MRSHNSGPKVLLIFYFGDKAHGSAAIEAELKKASPSFEESVVVMNSHQPHVVVESPSTPLRENDTVNISAKVRTQQSLERTKKPDLSSSYLQKQRQSVSGEESA